MGMQAAGLRMLLNELVTLRVSAEARKVPWRGNALKGFVITCPEVSYQRLWFTRDREWQRIDYPIDGDDVVFAISTGVSHGAVIYAVGVAIVGDILSTIVDRMHDHPREMEQLGMYMRECEIFLQRSIRTMVSGGYAHEAHQQADEELRRHLRSIKGLSRYDGLFGVAGPASHQTTRTRPDTAAPSDRLRVSAPTTNSHPQGPAISDRKRGTSLEQFTNVMANPTARRLLGINMSDEEGARIAADPALARAYYNNWTEAPATLAAPNPPTRVHPVPGARSTAGGPYSDFMAQHVASAAQPSSSHSRALSIAGLVLGVLAYLVAGSPLSPLLAIAALGVCIPSILQARAARGKMGATAALTMAIIGTVGAGLALLMLALYAAR